MKDYSLFPSYPQNVYYGSNSDLLFQGVSTGQTLGSIFLHFRCYVIIGNCYRPLSTCRMNGYLDTGIVNTTPISGPYLSLKLFSATPVMLTAMEIFPSSNSVCNGEYKPCHYNVLSMFVLFSRREKETRQCLHYVQLLTSPKSHLGNNPVGHAS